MDQSICLWSYFTKSFLIKSCCVLLSLSNRKIAFYYRLLVTNNDALHVIHVLIFDLLLDLYYP